MNLNIKLTNLVAPVWAEKQVPNNEVAQLTISLSDSFEGRVKSNMQSHYSLGCEIGKDTYGSVRLCRDKATDDLFACKIACKRQQAARDELQIMQYLSGGHPSLVALKDVYEDSQYMYLVMELCTGGDLFTQLKQNGPLPECQVALIVNELMSAVEFCHGMDVMHRDIKPKNILLTDSGNVKLADFGHATRVSAGQSLSELVGTLAYMAPEVLLGCYTEKADIWSAGVVLHYLLVGDAPFGATSVEDLLHCIQRENICLNSAIWESISPLAHDLVQRMLTVDPTMRPTAGEVLRHPWIVSHTTILKNDSAVCAELPWFHAENPQDSDSVSPQSYSQQQDVESSSFVSSRGKYKSIVEDSLIEPELSTEKNKKRLFRKVASIGIGNIEMENVVGRDGQIEALDFISEDDLSEDSGNEALNHRDQKEENYTVEEPQIKSKEKDDEDFQERFKGIGVSLGLKGPSNKIFSHNNLKRVEKEINANVRRSRRTRAGYHPKLNEEKSDSKVL